MATAAKNLALADPEVLIEEHAEKTPQTRTLKLQVSRPAKALWLSAGEDAVFTDNLFLTCCRAKLLKSAYTIRRFHPFASSDCTAWPVHKVLAARGSHGSAQSACTTQSPPSFTSACGCGSGEQCSTMDGKDWRGSDGLCRLRVPIAMASM